MSTPVLRAKYRIVSKSTGSIDGASSSIINAKPVSADGTYPSVHNMPIPEGATGSEENKIFGKWTPSGELTMTVLNPNGDALELGEDYYLDFTPVKKPVEKIPT